MKNKTFLTKKLQIMKKIFKLFPVALAVLALASCSSDDLTLNGPESQVKDPNLLYVTVDNGNITRSGFKGYRRTSDLAKGSSVIFYQGDQIKLYDNTGDWRPQVWGYNGAATKAYRSPNNTVAVFDTEDADKHIAGGSTTRYTNGYGIFPATIAKFINEERSAIEVDLSMFRSYNYTREATTLEAPDGTQDIYDNKGTVPFWGVADAGEMKLNFLTGIGIADMSNVPAPTAVNKNNYLIIKSTKKLHDTYASVAFDPAAAVDPDIAVRKANQPKLVTDDALAATDVLTSTALVVANQADAAQEVAEDIIAIKLDGSEASQSKLGQYTEVYFPIVPGAQTVSVYLVKDVTTTETGAEGEKYWTIDATGAQTIAEEDFTVEAGNYYEFKNPGEETLDNVNTPQALADAIKALDAVYDRDFTLTVTTAIVVKNGTDKNGYMMDFGTYALKNNVTVKFAGAEGGFKKEVATPSTLGNFLTINTPAGEKELTIVYKKSGTEDLEEIVIDNAFTGVNSELSTAGKLLSPLVLTTENPATDKLPTIRNHSNNYMLTVAAATDKIVTSGKMTINAPGCVIADVVASKGLTEFKLDNGQITKLEAATTVAQKQDKIEADVLVKSTGTSGIAQVDLTNIPYYGTSTKSYKNIFKFESTWNDETDVADGTIITKSGIIQSAQNTSNEVKMVYTVSQLMALETGAANNIKIAGNMTLTGVNWTPQNLEAKTFAGYNANADKARVENMWDLEAVYPEIIGLNAPLLEVLTLADGASVSNMTFKNSNNFNAIYDRQGALARQLAFAGTVTIDDVNVNSYTIVGTTQATAKSYGGVLGMANATAADAKLIVKNVDINTLAITANKYVGGIIGQIADSNYPTVIFGLTAKPTAGANYTGVGENKITGMTFNTIKTPNTQADPEYKAAGAYVGYFKNKDADKLILVGENLNYTMTNDDLYTNEGRWGTVLSSGAYITFDIVMPQKLVGYSDNANDRKATFVTKSSAGKFANTVMTSYTKAAAATAATTGTVLYYVADTRE